jgi:hypothetical protein
MKIDRLMERLQVFGTSDIDYRYKRFFGNLCDVGICLICALLLTQLRVFPAFLFSFFITYFLYKFILESSMRTTFGKNLFSLSVITSTENDPATYQILFRNICRLIPLYGLPILLNKPGIHDIISRTRVTERK